MIKKEILIGFFTGIIFNAIGVLIVVWLLSMAKDASVEQTFDMYYYAGNLWMLITLGALPNLAAFFGFLKQNRDYRARGVLLATFVAAISAYLIYFL